MMELIHRLYRFLAEHRISPAGIKITIEFTDPEVQNRSEFLLMSTVGIDFDRKVLDSICAGQPWKMYGIEMQVKKFEYPVRVGCQCEDCQRRRRIARDLEHRIDLHK